MGFVSVLTWLQWRGLSLTGRATLFLSLFVLAPFAVLVLIALPSVRPTRWLRARSPPHWRAYINNIFWNVNYYDSASAWSAEFERGDWGYAMKSAVGLCFLSSFLPMLAATGASDDGWEEYHDGHYVVIARQLGGQPLAIWVVVSAAAANVGLFVAEMSSDSYQVQACIQSCTILYQVTPHTSHLTLHTPHSTLHTSQFVQMSVSASLGRVRPHAMRDAANNTHTTVTTDTTVMTVTNERRRTNECPTHRGGKREEGRGKRGGGGGGATSSREGGEWEQWSSGRAHRGTGMRGW